ncbi:MAG: hypothetical protein IJZ84_01670, partial [Lachnospiraceae bacterium]|nr:hypothetical protein [Lachnospiraceae bacterium]
METKFGIKKIIWMIIVIAIFVLQFFCSEQLGDDMFFSDVLDEMSLAAFLNKRYFTWSSRIVIEAILVFVASRSPWIWRILNAMVIIVLIEAVSKVFGRGETYENKILFSCLLLFIPAASLKSAGWITTTLNYLWVLAFGIVVIVSLRQIMEDTLKLSGFFISLIALIYATSMEQMAAILFGTYLAAGVYMVATKKNVNWMYLVQFAFIILSLCFILFSPGNTRRTAIETEKYFPVFQDLTVFQKVCMGFLVTVRYYVGNEAGRVIFLLLCV